MPKKDNFYSQTPVVSAKKLAGTNPVGSVAIGGGKSPTVPAKAGSMSQGLGSEPKHFFRHHLRPHRQKGYLRVSGHPGAHQLGKGVMPLPNVGKPKKAHALKPITSKIKG